MTVTRRRGTQPTYIIGKEAAMAKFSGYLIGTDFDGTLSRDGSLPIPCVTIWRCSIVTARIFP